MKERKFNPNRMRFSSNSSQVTDGTGKANARWAIVDKEFEFKHEDQDDKSQYLLIEGQSEGRLKRWLHAQLERRCNELNAEGEDFIRAWRNNHGKKKEELR